MIRNVLGVIVGYAVMFIVVFVSFTAAYLAMGADRAFEPGTYDVSMVWVIVSWILGTVAAIFGGWVCALIAKSPTAWKVLAAVVLVLGLLLALPVIMSDTPDPGARTGDVSNMDAMMKAQTPAWIALLNPVLGAVGIVIGGSLKRSHTSSARVAD